MSAHHPATLATTQIHKDLQIEQLPLATLIPYANNARTHSDDQVEQMAASMTTFGWTNPVLIDQEAGIIAGHGRVLAAQRLGISTVPCIRLAHLNDAQRRAYMLADNQLALNAGWDNDLLTQELLDLQTLDIDLNLIGFDDSTLEQLLNLDVAAEAGQEQQAHESHQYREQYGLIITCANAQAQETAYNELTQLGYQCKVVVT